ncbi:E3 ubiquitin-protein ligase RNF19A-like isoform X3 [Apostichopus japonicus]|uniref:E3 ubiquitin-protein ligase RNF19A-like isoform X3 n=1 Tax=Stichopus japonicus TaxID=307972 RepID=UPI003AB77AF2
MIFYRSDLCLGERAASPSRGKGDSSSRRKHNRPSQRSQSVSNMKSVDLDNRSLQSSTSRSTIAEPSSARKKNKGSIIPRIWPLRSKNRHNSTDSAESSSTWRASSWRTGTSRSAHLSSNPKMKLGLMECPLCLMERPKQQFPEILTCDHRSCRECLRQYLKIEITESRVNIACPECAEPLHPNDIKNVLQDDVLMSKYEEFTLRRLLMMDPDCRWCPAPDCGYAVIAASCASCPHLMCERPGCGTSFCYHCKQMWHPNQTCDTARQQRSGVIRKTSLSYSQGSASADQIKPCPRCTALIIKMDDGSCNHMTCAVCGAEFCWLCMKEISDLHYLSPSGCTFWGKKPWSRKKKILWQLGTLVGAPVGIALVAGIAIPAIIIGIPVYVGRKVHAKYANRSRTKRNFAIAGSVIVSVIVSPLIAALTVGIGVPIMLAYVYGVVPISLCRSGGCGVSTSNSGGVRIDFDDENDVNIGTSGVNTDTENNQDVQSVVTANASIGEASVMNRESTSHLEVAGVMTDDTVSDTASASTRAIAGASLTGSLSGSGGVGPAAVGMSSHHRMDVHAEIVGKRLSLSSESTSMCYPDSSSLVGQAGFIQEEGESIDEAEGGSPLEVHVDIQEVNKSRHSSYSSSEHERSSSTSSNARPLKPIVLQKDVPETASDVWELKSRNNEAKGRGRGKRLMPNQKGRVVGQECNDLLTDRLSINSELSAVCPESMSQGSLDGVECLSGSPSTSSQIVKIAAPSSSFTSSQSLSLGTMSSYSSQLPEVENDRPASCVSLEGSAPFTLLTHSTYTTKL